MTFLVVFSPNGSASFADIMLVSMTLDPSSLDASHFDDPCYEMQVALILEDILRCGVIVVDKQKRLMGALRRVVEGYRDRAVSKKIETLIVQLFKLEIQKFVEVDVTAHAVKPLDTAIHIACGEVLDLLVGQPVAKKIPLLRQAEVREYLVSRLRSDFQSTNGLRQIKTKEQLEQIVTNVTRYSSKLRFYDKFIGRCRPDRIDSFRQGLRFFIETWLKCSSRLTGSERVEIYSIAYGTPGMNPVEAKRQMSELAANLQHDTDVRVTGFLKRGDASEFHARYLQTDHAVLLIERGFDIFRPGRLIPFPIANAEDARSQLKRFRSLADA